MVINKRGRLEHDTTKQDKLFSLSCFVNHIFYEVRTAPADSGSKPAGH